MFRILDAPWHATIGAPADCDRTFGDLQQEVEIYIWMSRRPVHDQLDTDLGMCRAESPQLSPHTLLESPRARESPQERNSIEKSLLKGHVLPFSRSLKMCVHVLP